MRSVAELTATPRDQWTPEEQLASLMVTMAKDYHGYGKRLSKGEKHTSTSFRDCPRIRCRQMAVLLAELWPNHNEPLMVGDVALTVTSVEPSLGHSMGAQRGLSKRELTRIKVADALGVGES